MRRRFLCRSRKKHSPLHQRIRLPPFHAGEVEFAGVGFGAPGAVGDPGFGGAGVADAEVAVEGDEVGGVDAVADEREHDALGGADEAERFRIDLRDP